MGIIEDMRRRRIAKQVLTNGKSKGQVMAEFNRPKAVDYPKEGELHSRIMDLIKEYVGEISTVSVLGVLDLAKDEVKERS